MRLSTDVEENTALMEFVDSELPIERLVTVFSSGGSRMNLAFDEHGALLSIEFLDMRKQLRALRDEMASCGVPTWDAEQ